MIHFTIDVKPATKKNSARIVGAKRGFPRLLPSEQYVEYMRKAGAYMPPNRLAPIDYPVNIKAYYYMPTKRAVDITNLESALCDVLVHYKILADDNAKIVYSTDGSRVKIDREYPRTEVWIEEIEPEDNWLGADI